MASTSPRARSRRGGSSGRRKRRRFLRQNPPKKSPGGGSGRGLARWLGAAYSASLVPPRLHRHRPAEELQDVVQLARATHGRKGAQYPPPVGFLRQPPIADHQHAAIGLGTDQPPGTLLEADDGFRQLVVEERVPALTLDVREPRSEQWIVRRGEGQLVAHHQRQRVARHVDAFPEALASEQHGVAERAEAREQLAARALALDQQRIVEAFPRQRRGTRGSGALEGTQRREQQERAAAAGGERGHGGGDDRVGMLEAVRRWNPARHIEQGLMSVVERAVPAPGRRLGESELAPIEREVAVHGERGGGEYPGARAVLNLAREDLRDRKWRSVKLPAVRGDVEPANPVGIVALAPAREARCRLRRAPAALRKLVAALRLLGKLRSERREGRSQRLERRGEVASAKRIGF